MENKILSKLGYNSDSAKMIVNHSNSSYKLEIRTKDKDISNDNKFIKNLAEGFIIYLIYNKNLINTIMAKMPYSRPYPTITKIFETYYLEKLESYQPEPIAGLIITENVEAELIPKLIILEKEKFQDIINNKDLRAYIESEFEISFDILKNLTLEFIELLKSKISFEPETEILIDWILPDYIEKFIENEKQLFIRGYIDQSYKWKKHKTELADFLCVIINYKYFKPNVKGKKVRDFHKRQFISVRYGYEKTGLTETWKKKKPKFELACIPFSWVINPE
jgi:hypothetical protein